MGMMESEKHKILEANKCYYDAYSDSYRYNEFGGYLFVIDSYENGNLRVKDDYGSEWEFTSISKFFTWLFIERGQPRG